MMGRSRAQISSFSFPQCIKCIHCPSHHTSFWKLAIWSIAPQLSKSMDSFAPQEKTPKTEDKVAPRLEPRLPYFLHRPPLVVAVAAVAAAVVAVAFALMSVSVPSLLPWHRLNWCWPPDCRVSLNDPLPSLERVCLDEF